MKSGGGDAAHRRRDRFICAMSVSHADRSRQGGGGFGPLGGEAVDGLGSLMISVCTTRPPEWVEFLTTGWFSLQEGGREDWMEAAADNWMNEEVEMRNKGCCCCCGCCGRVKDRQTDRQMEGREGDRPSAL